MVHWWGRGSVGQKRKTSCNARQRHLVGQICEPASGRLPISQQPFWQAANLRTYNLSSAARSSPRRSRLDFIYGYFVWSGFQWERNSGWGAGWEGDSDLDCKGRSFYSQSLISQKIDNLRRLIRTYNLNMRIYWGWSNETVRSKLKRVFQLKSLRDAKVFISRNRNEFLKLHKFKEGSFNSNK